jgi:alpha-tubulin suppressor-like RCC1 family protein
MPGTSNNGAVIQYVPLLPVPGAGAAGRSVQAISATRNINFSPQLLFSLEDGSTYAQGYNYNNCLGAGGSSVIGLVPPVGPVDVSAFWSGVTGLQGGSTFTVGLLSDATVVGVGNNGQGELGLGGSTPAQRVTLGALPGLSSVTALAAGSTTAMAVSGGNLWVWGYGYGFLPNATAYSIVAPTAATTSGGFTAVSVGDAHALAIGPGGAVYAFGSSSAGALGDGTSGGSYVTTPTVVTTQ